MKKTKGQPILLCEANGNQHYFPTPQKAFAYGMPDDKVYIVYPTRYKTPTGRYGNKFNIARNEEFSYDYVGKHLFRVNDDRSLLLSSSVFEWTDKMNIVKTYRRGKTLLTALTAKIFLDKFFGKEVNQQSDKTKVR
jgi:hypothetical protein